MERYDDNKKDGASGIATRAEHAILEEAVVAGAQAVTTKRRPSTPLPHRYPEELVAVFQDAWRRLKADFVADKLLISGLEVARRWGGW